MDRERGTAEESTRRQLLAIFGTMTPTALAGCSGNGDGGSSGDEDGTSGRHSSGSNDGADATSTEPEDTSPDDQSTEGTSETDDLDADTGGSSDGCPSVPCRTPAGNGRTRPLT